MEVAVTYYNNDWWPGSNIKYTCQVQNAKLDDNDEKVIKSFKGTHKSGRSDADVIGIRFDDCRMNFMPHGFCSQFQNLQIFLIFNSKIGKLEKNDFLGCGQLKELWFNNINVEYLPGNLFDHMPDLEIVSIQSSGIKYIDSELLDNLQKLKVAKFNSNAAIDAFYDSVSKSKSDGISLEEMKEKLKELRPPVDYELTYHIMPKSISVDIKNFMQNEKFKDLTISVDGEDFKVHKFLLAARSSILADMIYENTKSTLELTDMKKEIFKDILTYIYDDKLPPVNTNAFELFSAACRFGLEMLKKHAISNMTTYVTADNALDLLIYGNRYGNEQLKENAFKEIKKMLPNCDIPDEWISKPDALKEVIGAKKKMEEMIKKAQEDFDSEFLGILTVNSNFWLNRE